jgi:hypothetical protein
LLALLTLLLLPTLLPTLLILLPLLGAGLLCISHLESPRE